MPSCHFPFLHPWDREKPMRDEVDESAFDAKTRVRARSQEHLAQLQTKPWASIDVTPADKRERDA